MAGLAVFGQWLLDGFILKVLSKLIYSITLCNWYSFQYSCFQSFAEVWSIPILSLCLRLFIYPKVCSGKTNSRRVIYDPYTSLCSQELRNHWTWLPKKLNKNIGMSSRSGFININGPYHLQFFHGSIIWHCFMLCRICGFLDYCFLEKSGFGTHIQTHKLEREIFTLWN